MVKQYVYVWCWGTISCTFQDPNVIALFGVIHFKFVFFWKNGKIMILWIPKAGKPDTQSPLPHTIPPPERTWYQGYPLPDRLKSLTCLWKLYLPATSFAVGRNANANANAISPWRIEFHNNLQNGTPDAYHNTQKFIAGGSLAKLAYYSTVPQKRFSIVETNKVTISLKLFWSMFWCEHLSICALMRAEFLFCNFFVSLAE